MQEIIERIQTIKPPVLIAIEGRCAAGKTTMGEALAEKLGATLIHMDDFFLQKEQRTKERLAEPGGNVDRERFLEEVLKPLKEGEPFSYRPFECHRMDFGEPVLVTPGDITIVEGSYSCHPLLREYYDLHIFLDVDGEEQKRRILHRGGADALEQFVQRWIPLEEHYFESFQIADQCEIRIKSNRVGKL